MVEIRPAVESDFEPIYALFNNEMVLGETYVFPADMSREDVFRSWMGPGYFPYVAVHNGTIAGTYTFHANHPGRGAHVANASYLVSGQARGEGIGRTLGEHSLTTAKNKGFKAIQFNIVVSTNEPAVRLWKSLGFNIVGTIPDAFQHPVSGLVDIYVMHRFL